MLLLLRVPTTPSTPIPDGALGVVIGNSADATASLVIGTITIEQDGAEFTISVDDVSGQTFVPGQAGSVGILYTPTGTGSHTAILRVPSSDPDESVLEVRLTGAGALAADPIIDVTPVSWDAGSAAGSTQAPEVTLTIANVGTTLLTLGAVVLSGSSFTQFGDDPSGLTIEPGATRSYSVRFTPSTTGAKTGSIAIPSDGGSVVVALVGTGTKVLSVYPASWAAGSLHVTGESNTLTAQVRSTGTVSVTVGTVAVTGTGFAKGTDGATAAVLTPSAQTADVQVIFDPSGVGALTGQLAVPSDATGGTINVPLTGTGVADVDPAPPPPDPPTPPPDPPVSVTRFYLGRQSAPIALPSGATGYNAGWWQTTTDAPTALTVAKGGPATANATSVYARRGEQSLHGTWIGPPMAAQTITTTFTAMLPAAWRSSYLGAYVTSALRFLIWRAATDTLTFWPVLAHATPVDAWKEAADALPRRFPGGDPRSWSTSLTFGAGDRLVVQLGCKVTGGPTDLTSAATRIRYGGSSAQSDTSGSIYEVQPDTAGWIDFTDALLVLP